MSDRRIHLGLVGSWIELIRSHPVLEPEPRIRDWVEGHRLPIPAQHNRMAAAAGKVWEFSQFSVLADWIFDFLREPTTEVLFADGSKRPIRNRTACVIKDSQSGCSSIGLHGLAWWARYRGGNMIFVTDCRQQARDFARDRLSPVLDAYPELRAERNEKTSTAMALRYSRGTLYLGGGQSASEFISKPASISIADEVAKHDLIDGMPSLTLLEGRITGDDDARLLAFSTPDDALDYEEDPITGRRVPVVTRETVIHSSYLRGTQERCEVPCPHCGHWQELVFEGLRFGHCKESLPFSDTDSRPVWNRDRVLTETYYECAGCKERIDESAKGDMIARRRFVAQNLSPAVAHRSLAVSSLLNQAFASRRWGAIANAFIDASEAGSEASIKAFHTEFLGRPFARYQTKRPADEAVAKLRRGYRRLKWDGQPALTIPLNSAEIRFLGLTADVQRGQGNDVGQIGEVKWAIFAAGWDGSEWVLDWGTVPELEDLPSIIEARPFKDRDDPDNPWTVAIACIDTGYREDLVTGFLAAMGGSTHGGATRWVGIRGRSAATDRMARVSPRWTKEYQGRTAFGEACLVRLIGIKADHWEHELHIERIAKAADGRSTRPAIHLPIDTPDDILAEIGNMEHFYDKPNKGNVRELRWRKRNAARPNDMADLLKYGLVLIHAVEHDEQTQV